MENDKWIMFKNYMHNELGITKDDIRAWIKEAAEDEAKRLVKNECGKFDINSKLTIAVRDFVRDRLDSYAFRDALAKKVIENLTIHYEHK